MKVTHELEPCFLVAAPSLSCPFFNHTVVFLVDHREDGSLGFVVNKPADVELSEIFEQVGVDEVSEPHGRSQVMLGGPVSPQTGWVVFDPDNAVYPDEGVLHVQKHLGVSANLSMLEDIARGDGPQSYLMVLGYAGWGPGQLDDEIREGAWITVDLDPKLVFDTPVEQRWALAFSKLGIDPARVASQFVADA